MKSILVIAVVGSCLLFAGCTSILDQIDAWEADGKITPEVAANLKESVTGGWAWLKDAGLVLLSAAAAWAGIRLPPGMLPGISRGASTQKLIKNGDLKMPTTPAAPV